MVHQAPSGGDQIRLVERFSNGIARGRQKSVGDTATDNQTVATLREVVQHLQFGRDF